MPGDAGLGPVVREQVVDPVDHGGGRPSAASSNTARSWLAQADQRARSFASARRTNHGQGARKPRRPSSELSGSTGSSSSTARTPGRRRTGRKTQNPLAPLTLVWHGVRSETPQAPYSPSTLQHRRSIVRGHLFGRRLAAGDATYGHVAVPSRRPAAGPQPAGGQVARSLGDPGHHRPRPDRVWAEAWQESWDRQQEGYMPDREKRLAALLDVVEAVAGSRPWCSTWPAAPARSPGGCSSASAGALDRRRRRPGVAHHRPGDAGRRRPGALRAGRPGRSRLGGRAAGDAGRRRAHGHGAALAPRAPAPEGLPRPRRRRPSRRCGGQRRPDGGELPLGAALAAVEARRRSGCGPTVAPIGTPGGTSPPRIR